ncbi:MAG: hypothetical protein PVF54_05155 [Anaerolineae bacterium]|jgi:hypothetical protein
MDKKVAATVRDRARDGRLSCGAAFRIAEALEVSPLEVGQAADELEIRLYRCQLGLFGYDNEDRIVHPAEETSDELEYAIREGLIVGRLPCAVAWALAHRFDVRKDQVANAAEKLEVRIGQCQLGAF